MHVLVKWGGGLFGGFSFFHGGYVLSFRKRLGHYGKPFSCCIYSEFWWMSWIVRLGRPGGRTVLCLCLAWTVTDKFSVFQGFWPRSFCSDPQRDQSFAGISLFRRILKPGSVIGVTCAFVRTLHSCCLENSLPDTWTWIPFLLWDWNGFFCKIRSENIWIAIQNFKNQKPRNVWGISGSKYVVGGFFNLSSLCSWSSYRWHFCV